MLHKEMITAGKYTLRWQRHKKYTPATTLIHYSTPTCNNPSRTVSLSSPLVSMATCRTLGSAEFTPATYQTRYICQHSCTPTPNRVLITNL